jgi:hypothetical protein
VHEYAQAQVTGYLKMFLGFIEKGSMTVESFTETKSIDPLNPQSVTATLLGSYGRLGVTLRVSWDPIGLHSRSTDLK